jgi:hypothetical protein
VQRRTFGVNTRPPRSALRAIILNSSPPGDDPQSCVERTISRQRRSTSYVELADRDLGRSAAGGFWRDSLVGRGERFDFLIAWR